MTKLFEGVFGFLIMGAMFIMPIAALLTHIVFCVKAAAFTGSAIALLIVGLLFFPLGVIHGISLWLGFSWI